MIKDWGGGLHDMMEEKLGMGASNKSTRTTGQSRSWQQWQQLNDNCDSYNDNCVSNNAIDYDCISNINDSKDVINDDRYQWHQ